MADQDGQGLGRRSFLAGLGGPVGALALRLGEDPRARAGRATGAEPERPLIERTLGSTGLRLPVVSMGVMNASLHTVLERSYERGVRLFDTAWAYQRGLNESMVGDVVQRLGCRGRVVIATKIDPKQLGCAPASPQVKPRFLERFAQSLERLKTSYVDILYFHGAWDRNDVRNEHVRTAFAELKAKGKVRFSGLSLHGDQASILEEMSRDRFWDVALVIWNATMGGDERLHKALETAAAGGIGLIAMKTQCGGGGEWAQARGPQGTVPAVPVAGARREGLNHSALLKWALRHPFVTTAIPGYTTFEQMEQNLAVGRDLEYTAEEREFLTREGARLVSSFCAQCGRCRAQCPQGVEVPALMRTYMYAHGYRNLELALATHGALRADAGTAGCARCESCAVRCPRGVDVAGRIAALRGLGLATA